MRPLKRTQDTFSNTMKSYRKSASGFKRYCKISIYKFKKSKRDYLTSFFTIALCSILFWSMLVDPAQKISPSLSPASASEQELAILTAADVQENDTALLPPRAMKHDDQGLEVMEVQDPASWELAKSLKRVDNVPPLREIDQRAVALATAYDVAKEAPKPFIEPNNGRINFYFGTMIPRIVCRPLRMTDIELEPGERVTGLNVADNSRWAVTSSTSGSLDMLTTHIIVKPHLPKIATNLLIHTDRRTYAIDLISVEDGQYMPFVGFLYPASPSRIGAESVEAWESLMQEYKRSDAYSAETKEYGFNAADPKKINLEYNIKVTKGKNVSWKPTNVYDVNGKTYIVMNKNMQFSEAPVIFEKKDKGEKLMNYRVHNNVYVIDRLFDVAIMTAGKDRVLITRKIPLSNSDY